MKSENIKELIRAHYESDDAFANAVKKICDEERAAEHFTMARMLELCVQEGVKFRECPRRFMRLDDLVPSQCSSLVDKIEPKFTLDDIVLTDRLRSSVERIILEYRKKDILALHGLDCRRKIMLYGPSGTGKTMTGGVIANELGLPYYVVRMHAIVDSLLGDTSKHLSSLFGHIKTCTGVYLLDEFDSIAVSRGGKGSETDVGEMRRVVNSLLKFIEDDASGSIILCATNMRQMLDSALFRRFDDMLEYGLPSTSEEVFRIVASVLKDKDIDALTLTVHKALEGMSQADIKAVCLNALKAKILHDTPVVCEADLIALAKLRKQRYANNEKE